MEKTQINARTICAISTPPGVGGIAVARISGPLAIEITDRIWRGKKLADVASHTAHLGSIIDVDGSVLDQGIATVYRAPKSFTGQDTVEISVHGSRWIQRQLIASLIASGASLAEPGEFTQQAFAAGRFDLAQAEAVADLIASTSRAAHSIAMHQMRGRISTRLHELRDQLLNLASLLELELDFSEEDVEFASRELLIDLSNRTRLEIKSLLGTYNAGAAIKDGIPIAIIGKTNAGKSSLLNTLLDDDRAIVSEIHGTTRDVIEDTIEMGDYLVRFCDTAGLRQTDDKIEQIGINRSKQVARTARIVLHIIDSTDPAEEEKLVEVEQDRIIKVYNKSDICTLRIPEDAIAVSALTGQGIEALKQTILKKIEEIAPDHNAAVILTNARHAEALQRADKELTRFISALTDNIPTDLAAQYLRHTLHHLSTVTGQITTPDILSNIFSHFCIGK